MAELPRRRACHIRWSQAGIISASPAEAACTLARRKTGRNYAGLRRGDRRSCQKPTFTTLERERRTFSQLVNASSMENGIRA